MAVGGYSAPIQELVDQLGRLPGIGPKSAQRIAFHLLKTPAGDVEELAAAISEAKRSVRFCGRCCNLAADAVCDVCRDPRRDESLLCVVEDPRDVLAFERTGEFRGLYHVLHGAINPMEGIGPEQLRMAELLRRIGEESVSEVIVGTNPNLEGEATAMYVASVLEPLGVRVTRLASGLPVGGDLEYADELTLSRALAGRRNVLSD
ncbi:MAG: recombination protein RecR [Acidimicrobiia bacterium]|nr:recombination protein RecR [Acidimicrobiia bacterium]MYE66880.1 recombination protein RecR [Acidimicrobiia bacterium]MYJ13475.1 recombination protein RecR [Acidimicrobiia bacterium]